jgi:uncharacterized repeat protein (TIGR03803 family)
MLKHAPKEMAWEHTVMKPTLRKLLRWALLLAVLVCIIAAPVTAQTFTTLHHFNYGSDGGTPWAELVLSGDTLYGTTASGGSSAHGTVYKVKTDGSGFTVLHNFNFGTDGGYPGGEPRGGLVLAGNTLYGTAYRGGTGSSGTVFAVNTDGSGFIALHRFTYGSDRGEPRAGLVLSGTTLYGTASHAGSQSNGTVFKVDTGGTGFATLHTFTGLGGQTPEAGLILTGNTLYGEAYAGGSGGNGTVYSLTLAAAAPRLAIARDGANVVLAWPVADAGSTLESTTDLTAPAAWTTVTPAPSEVAGKNTMTKAVTGTQIFYRLSQ